MSEPSITVPIHSDCDRETSRFRPKRLIVVRKEHLKAALEAV